MESEQRRCRLCGTVRGVSEWSCPTCGHAPGDRKKRGYGRAAVLQAWKGWRHPVTLSCLIFSIVLVVAVTISAVTRTTDASTAQPADTPATRRSTASSTSPADDTSVSRRPDRPTFGGLVEWSDDSVFPSVKESKSGLSPWLSLQLADSDRIGLLKIVMEDPPKEAVQAIVAVQRHEREGASATDTQINLIASAVYEANDTPGSTSLTPVGWGSVQEDDGRWSVAFLILVEGASKPTAQTWSYDPDTGRVTQP